jgi:K+-transporting ATPase KdpF subunit
VIASSRGNNAMGTIVVIFAAAAFIYLVYAIARPERF